MGLLPQVPGNALMSLQLLPAGVLRLSYPLNASVASPIGTDIFASEFRASAAAHWDEYALAFTGSASRCCLQLLPIRFNYNASDQQQLITCRRPAA